MRANLCVSQKLDLTEWRLHIPSVGWRVVSRTSYSCPFWERLPGKGLEGRISLRGKKVKILWVPDAPISICQETEHEGTLLFSGAPNNGDLSCPKNPK